MIAFYFLSIFLIPISISASQEYNKEASLALFTYVDMIIKQKKCLSKNIIKKYQERGANINALITKNIGTMRIIENCIHAIVHFGNEYYSMDNIDTLIECGANIHSKDGHGHSLLLNALTYSLKNRLIIETLLYHGSNPNEQITMPILTSELRKNVSPLMLCAHNAMILSKNCDPSLKAAELLIDNGAEVNAQDSYGDTPLHHISLAPHTSIAPRKWTNTFITTLFDYGANPFIQNNDKISFAHRALQDESLSPLMYSWLEKHKNNYEKFRAFKEVMHDKYLQHPNYKYVGKMPRLPKQALTIIFKHLNYPWHYEDQIDPDNFDIEKYK